MYFSQSMSNLLHLLCQKNVFVVNNGILNFLAFYFQAAKKFVSGKKTMATSGNLKKTPFVDEL